MALLCDARRAGTPTAGGAALLQPATVAPRDNSLRQPLFRRVGSLAGRQASGMGGWEGRGGGCAG